MYAHDWCFLDFTQLRERFQGFISIRQLNLFGAQVHGQMANRPVGNIQRPPWWLVAPVTGLVGSII